MKKNNNETENIVINPIMNAVLSRQEDRSILIEFEWLMPLVLPRSKYEYHFKGGRKKVYRINEDGTKDWIR